MQDEIPDTAPKYRRLHLRIAPGESLTDREGVTYVNESKSADIRMTVVRENKPRKELSSDVSESNPRKQ